MCVTYLSLCGFTGLYAVSSDTFMKFVLGFSYVISSGWLDSSQGEVDTHGLRKPNMCIK